MKSESARKKKAKTRGKSAGAASAKKKASAKKAVKKAATKSPTSKKAASKKAAKKAVSKKSAAKKSTSVKKSAVAKKSATAKKAAKKTAKAAPKKSKATAKKATKATAAKSVKAAASKATKTAAKTPAKTTKAAAATPVAKKKAEKKAAPAKTPKAPRPATTSSKARSVAAAAPSRANFNKPPFPQPLDPILEGEKVRNALRNVLRDSGLPRRIAHGAVMPALLATGRVEQLREMLDWALEERVPAFYLAESLLQSYLFVGFPRTINALAALHDVTQERRRGLGLAADPLHVPSEIPSLDRILGGPGEFGGGALKGRRIRLAEGPPMHLEAPSEGPGSFERYAREWWRRGSELCRAVYGGQYGRLRENLARIHPELSDWMVFEGYGKVLSRPVITPRERELWIIPLLMAQDVPEQLYSHLRGAKHLDVPMTRLRAVIWLASGIIGPESLEKANELLEEIESREDRREDRFRPVY